MADARQIVTSYLAAMYGGDAANARRYLADRFSFVGPAARIADPDQYLRATEHVARAVRRVETHKVFVDGQDVCVLYDLHIDGSVDAVSVAEWYRLEDERITSIRTILDTAPFTAGRGSGSETALDPVCGMSVERDSAAATRTHAGQTYYFCSGICAESFERQPERFVPSALT